MLLACKGQACNPGIKMCNLIFSGSLRGRFVDWRRILGVSAVLQPYFEGTRIEAWMDSFCFSSVERKFE